jgi:tetratricopeptide (TPR) repeat protein
MWMVTRRNDLPNLPFLLDRSPRAAQLRRRYGAGAALLVLLFSLLVAIGLARLVAILLLLLLAAGAAAFFLRDRRRRDWLRRAVWAWARGVHLRPRATDAPLDPDAPTVEQADAPEIPQPSLTYYRRRPKTEDGGRRAGTRERTAIGDGDALRCQAFGMRLRRSGHPHRAVPLHQSARLIFAETGNRRGEALAMNGLGLALAAAGEHEAALRRFDRARTLLHELGDSEREGKVLVNLAQVKRRLGDGEEAAELLRAAQARFAPDTYPYRLVEQHLQQPSSPV